MWFHCLVKKLNNVFHHATMERTWLRILLRELRFDPKKPMVLFCNNTTTIEIANNPIQHKDNLDFGMIKVPYIKSIDQLAYLMTHVVTSDPFCEKREKGESLIFVIEKLLTNTHWTWVYIYMLVGPTIQ